MIMVHSKHEIYLVLVLVDLLLVDIELVKSAITVFHSLYPETEARHKFSVST